MDHHRTVPVYQALAEDIHALGIHTVFGLMSDDTALLAVEARDGTTDLRISEALARLPAYALIGRRYRRAPGEA